MAATKPLGLLDSCFLSYVRSRDRVRSEVGSPIQKTYKLIINDDGSQDFKETGAVNLYEQIQAARESTDLALMIKRYEAGDESALDKVRGFYADVTGFPDTLAGVLQRLEDIKTLFMTLPPEMRDEFNHDPNQFFVNAEKWIGEKEKEKAPQGEKEKVERASESEVKNE